MKRILVLVNNLQQASYRVRIEALVPLMERRGFEFDVTLRPKSGRARRAVLRSAGDYHAVLLQRKLLDPGDAKTLRRSARRIVYDIDDAMMYHNRPVSWLSRWRTDRRFRATAAVVDHVVAGNEYLADMFRKNGTPVTVLPTVVDPARYRVKSHEPTDTPRLVWIGSRSTLPYVRQTLPALNAAAQHVTGLRLLTIADETIPDAGLPVDHVPWSADGESEALCRGDIGIAPTPTDRWTLGKCGFKIVQYMAAGLPVIASPVGANAEMVRVGETGFLPETDAAWVDAIAQLASDPQLRARMGQAGRRLVEEKYCLERIADEWAKILSQ